VAVYNTQISRTDVTARQPEDFIANAILEQLPLASLILSSGARRVQLSKAQARFPVISLLPEAYFVAGDQGLKQTTTAAWKNKFINVEELAVILPIPESVIDDSDFDILGACQPLIAEAMGAAIDNAVIFGVNKPSTWDLGNGSTTDGLVQVSIAKGNNVSATGVAYADLISLGKKISADGHPITSWVADALLEWDLMGVVDDLHRPLFMPSPQSGGMASLLGRPFTYLNSGVWPAAGNGVATILAGDFNSRLIVGLRRDMTFEVFREGVIQAGDGSILLNLMQQDSRALRVTMRIGVTVGNPLQRRSKDDPNAYPFGVLVGASGNTL
jgi:HK97 family phage major capsid protein